MVSALMNDVANAWRGLWRAPFYPIVALAMIGLAAGANMTAFGLFYGYQLKPLPYAAPSHIALISLQNPRVNSDDPVASPEVYQAVTAILPAGADAGLWFYTGSGTAEIGNVSVAIDAAQVTPSFFSTLGVRPMLGRLPSALSGTPNGPHEAVISEQFWKQAYGGRADIIGQHIAIKNLSEEIVGVLPAGFSFVSKIDLWAAFSPPTTGRAFTNKNVFVPLRLPPGQSISSFNVQLALVLNTIEQREAPDDAARTRQNGVRLVALPIRQALLGMEQFGALPEILQGMSLLLLVLAVANAGNLALVRNRGKLPEFALQRILGAGRLGLLRLFLLEHLPIFLAAGIVGSAFGWAALRRLGGFGSTFDNPPFSIDTGWPVYAVCWGSAAVATALISLAPAIQIARQRLGDRLEQGNRATLSPAARRTQNVLGALQVALAGVLLIGSFALSMSLHRILTQPTGFATQNRIVVSLLLPQNLANVAALQNGVNAVGGLPITRAAAGSLEWSYPLTQNLVEVGLFPDRPSPPFEAVYFVPLIGDYLTTFGIPIEAGHGFSTATQAGTCQKEIIVSRNLADASFSFGPALGKLLELSDTGYKIIGITPPILWQPVGDDGISGVMFYPASCMATLPAPPPFNGATIIAHVQNIDPGSMTTVRNAILHALPGAVVTDIEPYAQVLFASVAFRALIADLVVAFALIALLLAALGVFAVNASIARARFQEFGMRAMLGASPSRLFRVALVDAGRLLAFGLAGAMIGGYALVRAMSPVLFHVDDIMPLIFIITLAIIALIVLLAAWRPAARAASLPVKRLLEAG
jgi:predicted permease